MVKDHLLTKHKNVQKSNGSCFWMSGFGMVTVFLYCMQLLKSVLFSIQQESEFLQHIVLDLKGLELRANACTKVYVWHTKTEKNFARPGTKKKDCEPPSV
jgi:hypothetical protein